MTKLNIGIITGLSLMRATTIVVPTIIAATDHGSTPVTPEVFTVTGTVSDDWGNKIAGANVSCNGESVKTNDNGQYSIRCTKGSAPIYIEKAGYIGEVITKYSFEHSLDVVLIQYVDGVNKTFSGIVKDTNDLPIKNCSVTFYPDSELYKQTVRTDDEGAFTVTIRIEQYGGTSVPYTINRANCDPQQQILIVNEDTKNVSFTAQPYQYDVKAFVSKDVPSNCIIMHAHHIPDIVAGRQLLKVSLEANYNSAFDENAQYTLTFNVGDQQSNPNITKLLGYNFSIDFTSKEVKASHGYTDDKPLTGVRVNLSENKLCLDVQISSDFFDFRNQGTIGIHLTGNNGYFQPYGHHSVESSTTSSNQLCYVRLGEDNTYFQASDNVNPFDDLSWETKTEPGSNWKVATLENKDCLGWVGPQYNHGYKVKLAKNLSFDHGIYVLTKYIQDQMGHWLPDEYKPHFFFDTNTYSEGAYPSPEAVPQGENTIKHYSPFSGYWMYKFEVKGVTQPFENPQKYDQFFDSTDARIYSKDDMMITYIPYTALWGIDEPKEFGFACNLQYQYTGGVWHAWQGSNPTGFSAVPHFEQLASYIRFNTNLEIIEYKK